MTARFAALGLICAALAAAAAAAPAGMALIPAGKYLPPRRPGARIGTWVPSFYLDVRPVTNGDFLAFVVANPAWRRSRVDPALADPGYLGDWASDLEPGAGAAIDAPVVRVSWYAARAYAKWRGKRLPTTSEWERAALAGFTTERGADDPVYREATLAWFSVPTPARLPASGSGRANVYGVRDLVDLVWEWVYDFDTAPGGAVMTCGGDPGILDYSDYPAFMRGAFRSALRANYVVPNLGFRCALSVDTSIRS